MASTTGAISGKNATIGTSVAGSVFIVTGSGPTANEFTISGGEIPTDEQHNQDTAAPIVVTGKPSSFKVNVKYVYSETAGELHALAEAIYTGQTDWYLQICPKGVTTGNKAWTTSVGKIITPPFAMTINVGEAAMLMGEFTLICSTVTPSTLA